MNPELPISRRAGDGTAMIDLGPEPRILITRLSAIGDCVHTMPLVAAIRSVFPKAFIAWATQAAGASLLDGLEGLDELIVVDRGWMKHWSTIRSTASALRSYAFDVAIDPQSLTKSSSLGWLSGARHRIGFAKGQARELSPFLNTIRVSPQKEHVVEVYLELLRPIGIENPSVEFKVPAHPQAETSISDFISRQRLQRFAVLNPGAGWNSKIWPCERYAEVAHYLRSIHRLPSVVIWSGEKEKSMAETIVSRSRAILAPPTSLPELAAICRKASMFIGSDTGPMHLAAAVGAECIAMYGPTKPSVCGPFGEHHKSLQAWYQDGTSSQRRGDDNSAMRDISVDMVCHACDWILMRNGASRVA